MKMHTFFLSGKAIAIVSGAFGACGMLLFISGVLIGVRVQVDGAARGAALTTRSAAAVETRPLAQPGGPVATPSSSPAAPAALPALPGPAAAGAAETSPAAAAAGASVGTTADAGDASAASAAWPFTSSAFAPSAISSPESAPVETEPAPLPVTESPSQAPTAPAAPVQRATMGDVSMIAYVAPASQRAAGAAPSAHSLPQPAPRDNGEYLVQVGIFRVEQHAKDLVARLTDAGYRATITERQEGDRALHVVRVGRFTGLETAEKVAARIGGSEQLVASVVAAPR